MGAFLDEVLRLYPPELFVLRSTTGDVSLGGVTIPAGARVHLAVGAANRDPRRFPDPDRLVLGRPEAHLTFGAGSHRCPGARFARLAVSATLDAVLDVMPDFEVVQPPCALRVATGAASLQPAEVTIAPTTWTGAERPSTRAVGAS
jgi:cytochrome P450